MAFKKRTVFNSIVLTSVAILCLLVIGWFGTGDLERSRLTLADKPAKPSTSSNSSGTRILLVSALYPLEKSKHSQEEYREWLRYFLGQITTDIYFYAPPSIQDLVLQTRTEGLYMKLNTSYPSAFSTPPLQGKEEVYQAMHQKDRERARHSPELYSIWNAKPFFLNEAVRDQRDTEKREYDYAFWVDAGSFRGMHAYERWPDPGKVDAIFAEANSPNSILIPLYGLPGYNFRRWKEDMGPVDDEVSEGSFFGGSPTAIDWYASKFYAYHDYYLSLGYFVGKDQTLINSLLLLFPQRFSTLWQNHHRALSKLQFWTGRCGPYWYFYEFVFSSISEQRAMEKIWRGYQTGFWKTLDEWILRGGSYHPRHGTPVLEVLPLAFGPSWTPKLARGEQ